MGRSWVAGAVVAALVTACSPAPESSPRDTACEEAHVVVTATPWTGAAGSRWSDVLVEHAGDSACFLPPFPVVGLIDGEERLLLESDPETGDGPLRLDPGGRTTFTVRYSNACERGLAVPVVLYLALDAGPVEAAGAVIGSTDELPPCNAPDQPPSLEAAAWSDA